MMLKSELRHRETSHIDLFLSLSFFLLHILFSMWRGTIRSYAFRARFWVSCGILESRCRSCDTLSLQIVLAHVHQVAPLKSRLIIIIALTSTLTANVPTFFQATFLSRCLITEAAIAERYVARRNRPRIVRKAAWREERDAGLQEAELQCGVQMPCRKVRRTMVCLRVDQMELEVERSTFLRHPVASFLPSFLPFGSPFLFCQPFLHPLFVAVAAIAATFLRLSPSRPTNQYVLRVNVKSGLLKVSLFVTFNFLCSRRTDPSRHFIIS